MQAALETYDAETFAELGYDDAETVIERLETRLGRAAEDKSLETARA